MPSDTPRDVRHTRAYAGGLPSSSEERQQLPQSLRSQSSLRSRRGLGRDSTQTLSAILDEAGVRLLERTEDLLLCQQNSVTLAVRGRQAEVEAMRACVRPCRSSGRDSGSGGGGGNGGGGGSGGGGESTRSRWHQHS
jgi:hypothetical protein